MTTFASPEQGVLETPPPHFSLAEAAAMADRLFGIGGHASALESERDQNIRIQVPDGPGYVLKISNAAEDPAVVDMQTETLRHIARTDPSVPVPRTHPSKDGEYHPRVTGEDGNTSLVRLIDFMPGRMFEAPELSLDAMHHYGASVARVGRALRGFFHPAAQQILMWDVRNGALLRPLLSHVEDGGVRALVERALDRFDADVAPVFDRLRAQVIHGDMTNQNVLLDEQGSVTGVIDFGDMSHTALVCDLARLACSPVRSPRLSRPSCGVAQPRSPCREAPRSRGPPSAASDQGSAPDKAAAMHRRASSGRLPGAPCSRRVVA